MRGKRCSSQCGCWWQGLGQVQALSSGFEVWPFGWVWGHRGVGCTWTGSRSGKHQVMGRRHVAVSLFPLPFLADGQREAEDHRELNEHPRAPARERPVFLKLWFFFRLS